MKTNRAQFFATKIFGPAFLLLVLALLSGPARAYQGAVTGATAQSGRAALDVADTPFLNPAGVRYMRGYHFASTYSSGSLIPEVNQRQYSLSLTDNVDDTIIPTSLGFNETVQYTDDRKDVRKDFQLSFAYEAFPDVALGLTLGYQDDSMTERYKQTKASIGGLWYANSNLAFAAVFEGLVPSEKNIPVEIRQRPSTHFGTSYLMRKVIRMKADLSTNSENSLSQPTLSTGVESFLTQWVIVRVGTQYNSELKKSLYTGGIGFQGPRFSANYAYMTESINNQTRHAVDLNIPLW